MFRTVGDQPALWEAVLPLELLRLPEELARVDVLLDDSVFFAPFVSFFDPRIGRPSTPMETYLRLMFLKFRYRLGYESLCREVADSITWRRSAGSGWTCGCPQLGPATRPACIRGGGRRGGRVGRPGCLGSGGVGKRPQGCCLAENGADDVR